MFSQKIEHVLWITCKLEDGKATMFPVHMIQCMEEIDPARTRITLVSGTKFDVTDSIQSLWSAICSPSE
jgi:uncharacterized protein YlzI (FlbEa/FlbD family)